MNKAQIQEIINSVMMEHIVNRVKDKITLHNQEALVVFSGSKINFEIAMNQLEKLEKDGMKLSIYLTENAENVLDIKTIHQKLNPKQIYTKYQLPEEVERFDNVILATTTINTASKISNCILDTPATKIVLTAMMKGKNVIIAVDGCCPDNKERLKKGYQMTEALQEQLRLNMKKMAKFGGYLTTLDNLHATVVKRVDKYKNKENLLSKEEPTKEKSIIKEEPSNIIYYKELKVIGNSEIQTLQNGDTLIISKKALVTSLAEERSIQKNIKLIRK